MKLFRHGISVRGLAIAALALALVTLVNGGTTTAQVSVGISVNFAPPELPVYEQPLCPGEGYIWTPGYWAWDPDYGDYYWVPGTWVLAPQPGYLWTPPYWGWSGVAFVFHEGYWGPRVGFYGGINYGYGYAGRGYYGGRWERDRFYYNRNVNNINVTQIHNVYNRTVVNNVNVTRVSYNGGNGGIRERANRQEEQAAREQHLGAVAVQQQHIQEARTDRALRASDNHGKPPIAATDRPGQFRGGNVVPAKEGKYNPPPSRGGNNGGRYDNNRGQTATIGRITREVRKATATGRLMCIPMKRQRQTGRIVRRAAATPRRTRNISSAPTICTRNRNRNGKTCRSSRTNNMRELSSKGRTMRAGSRWKSSTSNRRRRWSSVSNNNSRRWSGKRPSRSSNLSRNNSRPSNRAILTTRSRSRDGTRP
jgi:WXXGXW repeat (2 copies)